MKTVVQILVTLSLSTLVVSAQPVATLDGEPVVAAEALAPVERQLLDLDHQAYELKREAIERHLFERVQERLAASEGITREALYEREVVARAATPPAEQVTAAVQQFRDRLPADDAAARKVVEAALREQFVAQREMAWRREILEGVDYEILIDPVRYPIPSLSGDAVIGPAEAPVTLYEFSDFQCPYCARSQTVIDALRDRFGDRLRIVFKQFPLDIHPQARLAAEASLCARDQGRFEEMHDWLFAHPREIAIETMTSVAPELGIDAEKLASCLREERYAEAVDQQVSSAVALGVDRTPMFFVNGRKVSSSGYESLRDVIEEELPEEPSTPESGTD